MSYFQPDFTFTTVIRVKKHKGGKGASFSIPIPHSTVEAANLTEEDTLEVACRVRRRRTA